MENEKKGFTPIKLGKFEMMEEPISNALAVELRKVCPHFEQHELSFLDDLTEFLKIINERLQIYVEYISQTALLKKYELSVTKHCCHSPNCMLCLGKYQNHYPYFRVKRIELIENKQSKSRQNGLLAYMTKSDPRAFIRERELEDFLLCLGIEPERIRRFKQIVQLRNFLIELYHTVILTFYWMGVSDIKLAEPEEEQERGDG